MSVKIRTNEFDDELYCVYSKEKIALGEKYALVQEEIYNGEIVEKAYKLENVPPDEDEDDVYIMDRDREALLEEVDDYDNQFEDRKEEDEDL